MWNGVQRHLFPDATGHRFGRRKVGRWHDFTRIPGRARSHTTANKWETFRLVGTFHGHVLTYTGGGRHTLMQPHRMPTPAKPDGRVPTDKGIRRATWWGHTGPLAVVFAGGPDGKRGDLVLPVRIPQGPGQEDRVRHFLEADARWHKVDLVRRRKASAPGGWTYEAHLMVLGPGYASPAVRAMRDRAAQARPHRRGGRQRLQPLRRLLPRVAGPAEGKPVSTEITLSEEEERLVEKQAKKRRGPGTSR